MSMFDFDIEAALHTCASRIWAMENPEQHEANKKRSCCNKAVTEKELEKYKEANKMKESVENLRAFTVSDKEPSAQNILSNNGRGRKIKYHPGGDH